MWSNDESARLFARVLAFWLSRVWDSQITQLTSTESTLAAMDVRYVSLK